jgi:HAD superfamily hydrolase (TIGR01549 family)
LKSLRGFWDHWINLNGHLEVVLFDLDGTLRSNRPSYVESFYDHAVYLGVMDGVEKRRGATRWSHYYWASSPELAEDEITYKDNEKEFWINYAVRSLLAFDCPNEFAQELAPVMHHYMTEERESEDYILPYVFETLRVLKDAGFRLGVLSNRNRPYQEYLQNLGLSEYFEVALSAGEVEAWKPDPSIFDHVIRHMKTKPGHALYVGDNYYADVIGAQGAGIQPVLFDPEGIFPEAECLVIKSIGELKSLASLQ